MDSKPIEVAALSRALYPGMLYDCRNDSFIPGVTLWDTEAIKKNLDVHQHPSSDFTISTSNSLMVKSNLLDVSASLKASFMGGLIEVEGSAKYLKDDVSSARQCRVTMKCSKTVRYEQLTMSNLGKITYPWMLDKHTATHIITAVLYGAQAFMVFDQMASTEEQKQEIQGTLHMMVKKIPMFSIEGEGKVQLTEEEKTTADRFSCRFHGDFDIKQNPTTYLEAIEVYKTLPGLLGEKGEKAVPVKVWLYPMMKLHSNAAQLLREISVDLVSQVEKVLDLFKEVNVRANDMIGSCQLSGGGGEKEQKLVDILNTHNDSQFTSSKMKKWLDEKEIEMNLLRSYTDMLKDFPIMNSRVKLFKVLFDPMIETVVCFTFTSLQNKEPYLSNLTQCLQSDDFRKLEKNYSFVPSAPEEETQPWYTSPELSKKIRDIIRRFCVISENHQTDNKFRFIVASISDPSDPGVSIRTYRCGEIGFPIDAPTSHGD
ncbi:neoverrucotoxin subunit beta-like [Salvelinus namaycush]|uniref:Neoverrucotoxin subunit beta-like n=1 Tax=Salvelinus namaycush TaxID=8040 RepID=A0A8U0U4F7_SALNM|nr:neoverrucotoxin subunit beta-like [Salvelinus namaycush]